MRIRTVKIPVYFLLLGVFWAISSDPVITALASHHEFNIQDSIRGFNDLLFVILTTIFLYFQIRREHRKLEQSEKQYRDLFSSNPNPMWIYEVDSRKFIEVNTAAILKYGYSRREFLEMTIMDIRPREEIGKLEDAIKIGETTMSDGFLWEHRTKSGDRMVVSITSHRIYFNNKYCSMVMVTDVTEAVNSKRKLEQSLAKEKQLNDQLAESISQTRKAHEESRKMAEVINKINNLVIMIDPKGNIIWVNQAFSAFTGYSLEEAAGRKASEILFGPKTDMQTVALIVDALAQRRFFHGELLNYKKNGEEYWTQMNISPILDPSGQLDFSISVETVVTEQKEKEFTLNLHYKAFREIAWTISHETRRPLASILSLMALLKEQLTENEQKELHGLLERCSAELDTIIVDNIRKINALEGSITAGRDEDKSKQICH